MNNSIHSHLIAQQVQDRIEQATAARTVRAAKLARPREAKSFSLQRRLRRRATVEAPTLLGDVVTPR